MEIIQFLKSVASAEPDVLVVVGKCSEADGRVTVHPRPDDPSMSFIIARNDIVEGPTDFESNTAPYSRDDVKAIKVRKGAKMTLRRDGQEKEISLEPEPSQPAHLVSFASTAARRTYCIGLLEFDCGTDELIGPCIFGWDCS